MNKLLLLNKFIIGYLVCLYIPIAQANFPLNIHITNSTKYDIINFNSTDKNCINTNLQGTIDKRVKATVGYQVTADDGGYGLTQTCNVPGKRSIVFNFKNSSQNNILFTRIFCSGQSYNLQCYAIHEAPSELHRAEAKATNGEVFVTIY